MDQVHVIRHKVLIEGRSQRAVAKELGLSRVTVRKYVEQAAPARVEKEPRARPVWEKVRDRVKALLEEAPSWTEKKQQLTATRLHELLVAEDYNQVSFLDGHVRAFAHFAGVPARIAYDNLRAAVRRILVGAARALTIRFAALEAHYLFEACFCRPATGHDRERSAAPPALHRPGARRRSGPGLLQRAIPAAAHRTVRAAGPAIRRRKRRSSGLEPVCVRVEQPPDARGSFWTRQ